MPFVLPLTAPTAPAAFDKDDALFLRDEAEKARHKEMELRDAEIGKFARLRSELDAAPEQDGAALAASVAKRPRPAKCVQTGSR